MHNVHEIRHPLVQHHLARLRDRETNSAEFRHLLQRLSLLLAYEATQDLDLRDTVVQTPLSSARGRLIRRRIGVVPILRAGLGMVDPILNLIPDAEVWHLGFYRDEKTLQPIEYYRKLPQGDPVEVSLVLDPMLATGGSALAALEAVYAWGVKTVKLLAMIAAPEGVQLVHQRFPDTQLYICAIDERLNEHGYILPGLGDAGDRLFNAHAAS
jgi:uracil phosphoribosyltransferase